MELPFTEMVKTGRSRLGMGRYKFNSGEVKFETPVQLMLKSRWHRGI